MIVFNNRTRVFNLGVCCVCALVFCASAEDAPKDSRVRLHVAATDPYGGKLTFKWEQLEGAKW